MKFVPKLSRKLVFICIGGFSLLSASGAAALLFTQDGLGSGQSATEGLECEIAYEAEFRRGNEKRMQVFVKTDHGDGVARAKTAIRVAKHLAETVAPDMIVVDVLNKNGPEKRSQFRSHAIGAKAVFAVKPSANMLLPWHVEYTDSFANDAGYYYGETKLLTPATIDEIVHGFVDLKGCVDPEAEDIEAAEAKASTAKH